jgi:hypothetical protein
MHESRPSRPWLILNVGRKFPALARQRAVITVHSSAMRKLLVIALLGLSATIARGEEAPATNMRQKLLSKVLESAPVASPEKKAEDKGHADSTVIEMEAFTVVESTRARDPQPAVESEKEKIKAEHFSILKGGTIYRKDVGKVRAEVGGWYEVGSWRFLRVSW